ncbi:hypothetical protein ACFXTN_032950 [Malus domestica]
MAVAASMSDCLEYVEDARDATGDDEVGDGEMETSLSIAKPLPYSWETTGWCNSGHLGEQESLVELLGVAEGVDEDEVDEFVGEAEVVLLEP